MKLLGLTGAPGMGKSTVAAMLGKRGIATIDSDDLARRVVEPGQPAWNEVRAAFGDEVIDSTAGGQIRRDQLARIVFADPEARKRLEAIVHPRVRERWVSEVQLWRARELNAGVVVIPLLFETGAEKQFDAVICAACSQTTQVKRLLVRGWSANEIDQRCRAQLPSAKRMELADCVVWTEGSFQATEWQLSRLLAAERING